MTYFTQPEHVIAWFYTLTENNSVDEDQFNESIEQWADGEELPTDLITHLELFIKQAPFMFQLKNNKLIPTPIEKPAEVKRLFH